MLSAILKSLHNAITLSVIVQFKICFVLAELHADDDNKYKIETGSRIFTWRPFVY